MQQTTDTTINSILTTVPPMGAHVMPSPSPPLPEDIRKKTYPLSIQFTNEQMNTHYSPETQQLKNLIKEKIQNKEFFYGLEIMAHTYHPNTILDYSSLGSLLPLFTSIVWLGMDYGHVPDLNDIEAIQLAHNLTANTIVMPHFSCYHLGEERLKEFLNLNFSNVLVIRGDHYKADQSYQHSSELVEAIRKFRGDSITIAVAGYPEGHPESASTEEDMSNLFRKVSSGADFIITQICFSSQAIIDFIKRCRLAGIDIPIVVGIFVPDNYRMLKTILRITKIQIPPDVLMAYKQSAADGVDAFTEFAVGQAVEMINAVVNSDNVNVYGLQFFSMNKFRNIPKVLEKILIKK